MHSGQYPGSQAGLADLYTFDQDQQDWYPAGYWLWNLRGADLGEPVVRELRAEPADLRHVPERPAGDRVVDQRADERQAGRVRAGDHAVQRQRLLQRRRHHRRRLLRDRLQPELQRRDHHQRRGDRAVDLAAVPGHREPQLPAEVLPAAAADRHLPAGLAVRRLGRLPARGGQRARDAVGGAGPDHRHRRRPGAVPRHGQRGDAAGHRLLAGLPAAHRPGPDPSPTRAPTPAPTASCSARPRTPPAPT